MTVGDRVWVTVENGEAPRPPQPGTVIYINEAHRYYTVQLDAGYRQCFAAGTTQ